MFGQGRIALAVGAQQVGVKAQAVGIVRAARQRAREQAARIRRLALPHGDSRQAQQGRRRIGIEFERFIEQGPGFLDPAHAQHGVAAQCDGGRAQRRQGGRLDFVQDALIRLLHQQRASQQQLERRAVGAQVQRAPEFFLGRLGIALVEIELTQHDTS